MQNQNYNYTGKYRHTPFSKKITAIAGCFILIVFLFSSCKKNEVYLPSINHQLILSSSDSVLILNQKDEYNKIVTFEWTTGTNHGSNSNISYTLEIDKKGNNFRKALIKHLGAAVYQSVFLTGILNDSLLHYWSIAPGQSVNLEARIIAAAADSTVGSDTSNIIYVTATPYKPVTTTLYIIGDATSTSWDNNHAAPLTPDPDLPGVFSYQGTFSPGSFKFITTLGTFIPSYNKGSDSSHLVLRDSFNEPDNSFTVSNSAVYKITVDLLSLAINVKQLAQSPYSKLWIVGDATPNGWNIDHPNEMFLDPSNSFVFKYNEVLKAGEFKIPTSTGNWGTAFYRPLSNHPDITDTGVQLVPNNSSPANSNDYKWQISTAGPYKITLNLLTPSISIKPFVPYTKLWIVGDATPNGWNINTPTQLTPDAGNPYIFTYTGHLGKGEFKIPVRTGDFGCDYFRPYSNHPDITDTTAQFVPHGLDKADVSDYKWYIPTAGNYQITFDQLHETIKIIKQ